MMATLLLVSGLSAGAIVARAKEADLKIQDFEARIRMEIYVDGSKKTRIFDMMLRRDGVDYRATLSLIEPPEMAGTRFIVSAERGESNRMWAYFPDLDIVRPVKGHDQDDPFLGSDISYNDLAGGAHLDDLTHQLLGEEDVDGAACYVMEGRPRHPIAYGKLEGWVRKDNFVTVKARFYDEKDRPLKEVHLTDLRELDGAVLAHRIEMKSLVTDRRTLLQMKDVRINQGLGQELFEVEALRK